MSLKFYAQFAKHEPLLSWQTRHYHFRVRCQQFQDMVTVYLSYTGKTFRKDTFDFFILFLHHSGLLLMFVFRICSWRRKKQLNLFQFSLKFWRRALSKCFWCYCQWHSGRFTSKTESLFLVAQWLEHYNLYLKRQAKAKR